MVNEYIDASLCIVKKDSTYSKNDMKIDKNQPQ